MKKYYFALGDILREYGLTKVEARRRYGFLEKGGECYISKTGFQKLCSRPAQIKTATQNIICAAMDLSPADLWRAE